MYYAELELSSHRPWTSVDPRALDGDFLSPILDPQDFPPLPSPSRVPVAGLAARYALTTHIVPAVSPRTTRALETPDAARQAVDESLPKVVRAAKVKETVAWLVQMKRDQPRTEANPDTRQLWNVVNRYVRRDLSPRPRSGKRMTLVCYNATGMHKETWEPSLAHLVSTGGEMIDEIWAFEAVNHGDSSLLNAGRISALTDWLDQSRDALNFLLNYLPTHADAGTLPTHLPRLSEAIASARRAEGLLSREIVAIGHSWGGCAIVRSALACPAVFSSIVLIDPVILPYYDVRTKYMLAAIRPTKWSSREKAHRQLKASPMFGRWDPAVLDIYLECAVHDAPNIAGIQAKMSGFAEAANLAEDKLPFEVWELLPALDNRIALHWIMAGEKTFMSDDDDAARETVWRRKTHTSNVRIPGAGHLVPQEAPKALANELRIFLQKTYGRQKNARL